MTGFDKLAGLAVDKLAEGGPEPKAFGLDLLRVLREVNEAALMNFLARDPEQQAR